MKKFRFLEFAVYKEAKILHRKIIFLTKTFPKDFHYLIDQIRRSSLSVILNIAEGSGKNSDKDFNRYIKNSLGSINEVAACLDIAFDNKLISQDSFEELLNLAEHIKNQLGAFSRKLKAGS